MFEFHLAELEHIVLVHILDLLTHLFHLGGHLLDLHILLVQSLFHHLGGLLHLHFHLGRFLHRVEVDIELCKDFIIRMGT